MDENKKELLLIRGLPGSGKSTLAKLTNYIHIEADMFFVDHNGNYTYDKNKIKEAHEWCQNETRKVLEVGFSVVVSNTFIRRWEMAPYSTIAKYAGANMRVITAKGNWPNEHGVPAATIERMRKQWEEMEIETNE